MWKMVRLNASRMNEINNNIKSGQSYRLDFQSDGDLLRHVLQMMLSLYSVKFTSDKTANNTKKDCQWRCVDRPLYITVVIHWIGPRETVLKWAVTTLFSFPASDCLDREVTYHRAPLYLRREVDRTQRNDSSERVASHRSNSIGRPGLKSRTLACCAPHKTCIILSNVSA